MPITITVGANVGYQFFSQGIIVILYTLGSELFPTSVRSLGMGVVTATGRVGSIFGPLVLGNIAIGGVSEDVGTTIVQRVQAISPFANTFVVSQFFGPARYLVSDDTYGLFTYDSTDSHVKKGCAEQAILKGFLELMPK